MMFWEHGPSSQWEPLPVADLPGCMLWAWFRPAHSPQSVLVQIPEPMLATFGPSLTARRVLFAAGLTPPSTTSWTLGGMTFDPQQGHNPLLDQPFPPGQPGVGHEVLITADKAPTSAPVADPMAVQGVDDILAAAAPTAAATVPMPSAAAVPDAEAARYFAAIDADWRAIELLERQLASLSKQMAGQAAKLQSLNRDLSPQERLSADSNDVKAWQDVRRMLRDAAAQISKQTRAFDIGTVSAAGNRNRFADIFEQYVSQRIPFDNMAAVAQEFEQHRKVCQNLLTQSSSAMSGAQRDAEGKARAILARIKANAMKRKK